MSEPEIASEHTTVGYAALAQISRAFQVLPFVVFAPNVLIPVDTRVAPAM